MKAAVFYGPNQPLKLEDVPMPTINDDEVLIKVAACGVCHTDLHYIDHNVPTFKKPPLILGHEATGTIAAVGSKVKNVKEGDIILVPAVVSCGSCMFCRTGRENICQKMVMFGNDVDGAYAEYFKAPGKDVQLLPPEIPIIEGCVIADAITTPYHAVVNRAKVKPGDTVAVFGVGGVGLNVVQMAATVGAQVIAVGRRESKLEVAKQLGAVATLSTNTVDNVPKAIRKLTGGGVDVAIEAIGNPDTMAMAFESARNGGKLVIVGYTEKSMTLNASRLMYREMEVIGSLGCPVADYPKVIQLARLGKIEVKSLVTHKFPLDKINDALDVLRRGDGIRTVITFQ